MNLLVIGDSEAGHLAKFHEGFRTGLRRTLNAKLYGRGYDGYRPELRSYPAILDAVCGSGGPDLLLAFHLYTNRRDDLRWEYDDLENVRCPKAIVLSYFWNITENYLSHFVDWLEYYNVELVLCQYPAAI